MKQKKKQSKSGIKASTKSPKTTNNEILPDISKLGAYDRECYDENVWRIQRNSMVGDMMRLYLYQPQYYTIMEERVGGTGTFYAQVIHALQQEDKHKALKWLNPIYSTIWKNVLKVFNDQNK